MKEEISEEAKNNTYPDKERRVEEGEKYACQRKNRSSSLVYVVVTCGCRRKRVSFIQK